MRHSPTCFGMQPNHGGTVFGVGFVVTGGAHWSVAGYGQGNLSRLIFDMSKVGVLSTRLDVYCDVILVALALYWRLNSLPKVLDGDAKQAAFALCDALGAGAPTPSLPWSVDEIELSCTCDQSWCLRPSCPSWPSNNCRKVSNTFGII